MKDDYLPTCLFDDRLQIDFTWPGPLYIENFCGKPALVSMLKPFGVITDMLHYVID